MKGIIKEYLHETKTLISWLEEQWTLLEELGNQCINVIQRGGTLYFCGNGGSAAQANHIVTEIMGRFEKERKGFRAHSLSTNLSLVTALSNDYSFHEVFARQVETLMESKDLLVVISTSGRSSNILKAAQTASQKGIPSLGFTGLPGKPLLDHVDLAFQVPSKRTAHVQEIHLMAWHCICKYLEENL